MGKRKNIELGRLKGCYWEVLIKGESIPVAQIGTCGVSVDRFISCYNACTQFENPEQDIKKLIEALKITKERLNTAMALLDFTESFKQNALHIADEALSLVKE
jgi:hypothetical protein